MAKHKSRVICQFHLTVPPLATTLRKMVTQYVRMGNAHAGPLRTRRRQYTNPMSKFVSPKTFQSNKIAKIYKILVKLGLIVHKWGHQDDTKRRIRVSRLCLRHEYVIDFMTEMVFPVLHYLNVGLGDFSSWD
jgi:hypothetical protein